MKRKRERKATPICLMDLIQRRRRKRQKKMKEIERKKKSKAH
jgi:hypothetical protein